MFLNKTKKISKLVKSNFGFVILQKCRPLLDANACIALLTICTGNIIVQYMVLGDVREVTY